MFKVEWSIGGRRVPSERFAEEFADAIMAEALEQIKVSIVDTLNTVRCPKHEQGLTKVVINAGDLENMSVEIEGCCDEVIQAAYDALGAT